MHRTRCKCGCGGFAPIVPVNNKKRGWIKGATFTFIHGHNRRTHGHAIGLCSSEYHSWASMVARCTNPKSSGWEHYGGRGIKICKRWRRFENFLADMGEKPAPWLSLDRKNSDRGYKPSNCRWADKSQQVRNRRYLRLKRSTYRGVSRNGTGWMARARSKNGKPVYLGTFNTEVAAARAYRLFRRQDAL